jgi:hypothetical protein
VPPPPLAGGRKQIQFPKRCVLQCYYIEHRMMDKVQKPNNSECIELAWNRCKDRSLSELTWVLHKGRNFLYRLNNYDLVEFEVLTAVVMKITVFWDITPCSPLKVNRRFGGTFHLNVQGRISRASNQRESRKRLLAFNGLHRVISQKIVLFNCDFVPWTELIFCCINTNLSSAYRRSQYFVRTWNFPVCSNIVLW